MVGEIDELKIVVGAEVKDNSTAKINKFTDAIVSLSNTLQSSNWNGINSLSNSLSSFKTIDKTALSGINSLSRGLLGLNSLDLSNFSSKMTQIVSAVQPLQGINIGFENVKDLGTGMSKLAKGIEKLQQIDITGLDKKVIALTTSLKPLTDEMIRGGQGAFAYGVGLSEVSKSATRVNREFATSKLTNKSMLGTFTKFASIGMIIKRGFNFISKSIDESSKFIENLNLFEVTFGESSDATLEWAMNIQKAYKISSSELIRYTGLFKQMASAIGVANETAIKMSKSLSLIAYDISSLYNVKIENAMEKLRAAIAGQTKPVREWGLDITAQSMDKFLKDSAQVDFTSKKLSQSNKFILRTILLLEQASASYGDFARTINSFANTQRVLTDQIKELQLALGDILMVIVEPFLTALTAVTIGITNIIRALVPMKKETGIKEMGEDMGAFNDELDETNNKLGLLNFDKFNALNTSEIGADSDEVTNLMESLFDKTYIEYMDKVNSAIKDMSINAEKLAPILTPIALALGAMVATNILSGLGHLSLKLVGLGKGITAIGIASSLLRAGGFLALFIAISELTTNWDNLTTSMKAVYYAIGMIGVALLLLSNKTILEFVNKGINKLYKNMALAKNSMFAMEKATIQTKLAITSLGIGIGFLIGGALSKLPQEARTVIGVFLTLTGVVLGLAYAVGALQSAWTLGIAAAAIVAGVMAISSAISESQDKISNDTKYFAKGGTIDLKRGMQSIVTSEYGKPELITKNANKVQISNEDTVTNSMVKALRKFEDENSTNKEQTINFDVRGWNTNELARLLTKPIVQEMKNQGLAVALK